MGTVEVVPRIQQLSLQHPSGQDPQKIREFVESCGIGPEPFPFVFGATSSWFSSGKPLLKGWSGIGVDTREGALVIVELMEIVAYWEAAAKKSAHLQLQCLSTALLRTEAFMSNPLAQGLRDSGCLILNPKWKQHCAAMYDLLFIKTQAPTPVGDLELVVLAGKQYGHAFIPASHSHGDRQSLAKLQGGRNPSEHAQNKIPLRLPLCQVSLHQ